MTSACHMPLGMNHDPTALAVGLLLMAFALIGLGFVMGLCVGDRS
jgi:hypothetical protein